MCVLCAGIPAVRRNIWMETTGSPDAARAPNISSKVSCCRLHLPAAAWQAFFIFLWAQTQQTAHIQLCLMPVKRDANVDANLGGKNRGVHFVCYRHRRGFAASGASLDLFLTSNRQISAQDGKKFHSNGKKKKKKSHVMRFVHERCLWPPWPTLQQSLRKWAHSCLPFYSTSSSGFRHFNRAN